MTPPADLSPPRRPIFLPVVIATVFLTIITMTIGFTLGDRQRKNLQAGPTAAPQPTASATGPSFTPPGPPCPDAAQQTAANFAYGTLYQQFKIQTSRTVIWICVNAKNQLFYQSQTGNPAAPIAEGTTGLFLAGVKQTGTDEYQVTDQKGNVFKIGRKDFELDLVGKSASFQAVTKSEPS